MISPPLLAIAMNMARAGHDYVQIAKSTGLSYGTAEAIVAKTRSTQPQSPTKSGADKP